MTGRYDDETLMAFVDGRLEEPLFSAVADAVEADPDLADRVAALAAGAEHARALYGPLGAVPVPDALEARVRAMAAKANVPPVAVGGDVSAGGTVVAFPSRAKQARTAPSFVPQAIAASVAALVAGVAGYLAGSGEATTAFGPPAAMAALAGSAATGDEAVLDGGGVARVIASFQDGDGRFCREIMVEAPASYVTVLCRTGEGWRTELVVAAASADGSFTPASSAGVIDAYLSEIGAGAPLEPAEEAALLGR